MPKPKPDEAQSPQKTGRFIMRAHQTYRVLLNTPVFKQMKVGDKDGNEPPGKSISFAVIEDGKPTPYLVKVRDLYYIIIFRGRLTINHFPQFNDEEEAKTLYREVQKLQEAL